jgi:hypothetical protein
MHVQHPCQWATVAPWVLQPLSNGWFYQAPAECHLYGLDGCMAMLNTDPTGSHFSLLSMHECHKAFKCCWRQQGNMVNVSYLLRPVSMQQPAGHTETASQPSALMYKSVQMSCQLEPKLPHLTQLPIGVSPSANWSPCPMTNVSSLNFSLTAKIDSILSTAFLLRFV